MQQVIKIYVCGPTVYDQPHIGNLRPLLNFDLYTRALTALGKPFFYVHNITDIDDKIIAKAAALGVSEAVLAKRYWKLYQALMIRLNVQMPQEMPLVSAEIPGMIAFIERINKRGSTYQTGANLYFKIRQNADYGLVSGQKIAQTTAQEVIGKTYAGDFALWKATQQGVKFPTQWGAGRPGWHTECAYFIDKYFQGATIDVHGGGIDLIFPHHENENAIYQSLHSRPITKQWIHNGHLALHNEKMAKAVGNVVQAEQFLAHHDVDLLRLIFLKTSYSAPINLDHNLVETTQYELVKLQKGFLQAQLYASTKANTFNEKIVIEVATEVAAWNWSKALKITNQALKSFWQHKTSQQAQTVIKMLRNFGFVFAQKSLDQATKTTWEKWHKLRAEHRYEAADQLRAILQKKGII